MTKIFTVFMALIMTLSMNERGNNVVVPVGESASPNSSVACADTTTTVENVVFTKESTDSRDYNYSEKTTLAASYADDRHTENAAKIVYARYFAHGDNGSLKSTTCHTHDYSVTVIREATCAKTGMNVLTCTECGYSYREVVDKTEHDYKDTTIEPTCSAKGYTMHKCVNCGYGYKDTYVNAKGHDYKSKIIRTATCFRTGRKKYTCSCGASYVEKIAKTSHSYARIVVRPRCTRPGYIIYRCRCGHFYKTKYVGKAEHAWSEWKVLRKATENQKGIAQRICFSCKQRAFRFLPKLEHVHRYEDRVTKEATCLEEGIKTFECFCGASYTEDISRLTHNYSSNVVTPTCTNKGYTEHKCSNCGDSYKDNYTNVIDHNYSAMTTKESSCTEEGVVTYTCYGCNGQYTETIEKLDHNYIGSVTKPTCETDGYTTYTCSDCGSSYDEDKTAAIGHDYVANVVPPTCTDGGYTKYKCSRCDDSYIDTPTDATGHDYQFTSDTATCISDGVRTETCKSCGDVKSENVMATGHLNTTTTTVNATCVSDGYVKVTCDACGAELSNDVILSNGEHIWVTKRVPSAVQEFIEYWDSYEYADFVRYEEWNVQACSDCKEINLDTMTFMYSDYEAATIMLGYVNELREEHFGSSDYNLTLDSDLIETAKNRAIQISVDFGHIGIPENINMSTYRGNNAIYDHFQVWLNSEGHKANMLCEDYTKFGYGFYVPDPVNFSDGYGAQVFG